MRAFAAAFVAARSVRLLLIIINGDPRAAAALDGIIRLPYTQSPPSLSLSFPTSLSAEDVGRTCLVRFKSSYED